MKPSIVIVVPCYNEEEILNVTIPTLLATIDDMASENIIDYEKSKVELIGVEAGGSTKSKLHAAPLSKNSKIGILHGAAAYCVQNSEGQIDETESCSSGLDYPSCSPIHCFLKDTNRARYTYATDEEAFKAYKLVTELEDISPSLEPAHAFAEVIKVAPKLNYDDEQFGAVPEGENASPLSGLFL